MPDPIATLESLTKTIANRATDAEKHEKYYRGVQPLKFATEEWAKFHAARYGGFADNWCGVVVDSEAERLALTGIRLPVDEDAPPPDAGTVRSDPGARRLWDVWERSNGDAISSQGFVTSLTSRRSFTMVWGEDPRITWEHPGQVAVAHDPETGKRTAAVKTWTDGTNDYATVYYPDHLLKYQRPRGERKGVTEHGGDVTMFNRDGWEPREGTEFRISNPIGEVPIVEWPNRPMLAGDPLSEVEGVAAMQDAVNLMWGYLFTAADQASWTQRVLIGAEPPKIPVLDSNGNVVGEKLVDMDRLAKNRFLFLQDPDVKAHQFEPAKLDVFTAVIEQAVQHIAAQTRTPPHYLMGKMVNANAEALKVAETGLVKKTIEAQTFFGPAARETFRLAALAMGDRALADRMARGHVQWRNPEMTSDAQVADAILKKRQAGYPFRTILEDLDYPDFRIDRIIGQIEDEQRSMLVADVDAMGL